MNRERSGTDAHRPERQHARRNAPPDDADLQRAIPPRSQPRPARLELFVPGLPEDDGGVEGVSSGSNRLSPSLSIDLCWETVSANGVPALFHKHPYPENATPDLAGPQIYRWALTDSSDSIRATYIGQSGDLKRRLRGYRNGMPSRPADQLNRIRKKFVVVEAAGGTVQFQLLRFAPFSLNGVDFSEEFLSFAPARHILENLAICQARSEGIALLNRDCEQGWINVKLV